MGVLSREGKVDQRQHSYCSLLNTSEGFKPSSLSCLRITRPHSTDAGMSFPLKPGVLLAFPSALKYPRRSHSSPLATPLLKCLGVPPMMSVLVFLLPASSRSPYLFVFDNNLFRSRTHEHQKSAGICLVSSVRD